MMRHASDHPPDDDELSAEEIRQLRRRRIRRRLVVAGGVALAVIAISAFFGLPRITELRARQFATNANAMLAEGNLQEALNNASSAMQMRPDLPAVKRSYAAVLLAAGVPEALPVLQDLLSGGHAMNQDRLQLAEAALRFGDLVLAEKTVLELLQHESNIPESLFVLARIRLAQQRVQSAEETLKECVKAGGDLQASILLSRLYLAKGTPESLTAATNLLAPIASRHDRNGLDALLTLISSPALKTEEGPRWLKALRAHPLATDEQKLLGATAEIQLDPGSYVAVSRRMIEEFRTGTPEQRAQLARWLNQNREHQAVLDIIGPSEAASRSDLFLIRLDALAGRGDWQQISELLRADGLPLQAPIVQLYRGRAARETGKPASAATFYQRALIESSSQPELLGYVIGYLSRIGEDQILEQELTRLTDNPATARQAFQALVPIVQKRQDAGQLYDLYERMIQHLPADPIVQNDYRYFAALTGRTPDIEGCRSLVNSDPKMLAYRITLALSLLKIGQSGEALDVFDGVTLDPAQIQPYQRAVLAAVLGANQRLKEARELALAVEGDTVTEEEFKLIAPWRGNR